jgi:iron complex outermembrane receptor protein
MRVCHFGRVSVLAVTLALSSFTGHAFAQQTNNNAAPPPEGDTAVEELIVTGSLIGKQDVTLPVDVVAAEEISQRGMPTMVQLIKTIPASGSVLGENNRFGGGNGTSTVNLRNLGAARTLVLFNGRRIGTSIRSGGGVDVNLLPSNAIQRVEVLKDGAAATYGSDAIGGVVNFITRTDLRGLELNAQYQAISGSKGDYDVGLAWGYKGDRGNVLLTANYRGRSELPVAKRDWALLRGADGYLLNPLGGWAGTGNPGVYNTSTVAPAGSPTTGFTSNAAFNTTNLGTLTDVGCAAVGGAPYVLGSTTVSPSSCAFQYTVFDNLVEKEQNLQLYGQVNFDLTDKVRFHGELIYSTNTTPMQSWAVTGPNQWPTPILPTAGGAAPGGGLSPIQATGQNEQSRFYIPVTNPGLQALVAQINTANCTGSALPYGINASTCAVGLAQAQAQANNALLYGLAPSQTAWRPIGFAGDPSSGDRHTHYSYDTSTFRIEGGFKGLLPHGIGWDVSSTYQQIDYNATLADLSVNRLQMALAGYGSREGESNQCTAAETSNFTANAGNAALGCFYFNPFTNAYATSVSANTPNPYYIATSAIAGFNDAAANRSAVYNWFNEAQPNHNTSRLFVLDALLNGETPWKLWSETPVAWALGAQYRYDRTVDNPEPVYDSFATPCVDSPPFGDGSPACPGTGNGPFLFNANRRPYDVERKIFAGFTEVHVPVSKKVELTFAARIENYSGLGSTTNPKVSGRWEINDWLALRGSVGTTYRAPNATQTTTGFNRGLVNANGSWRANDTYGNPKLQAESADTFSVGAVFNQGPIHATFDYWSFDFANPITSESTSDLLALMFPGGAADAGARCGNPTYAAIQARFTFAGACSRANITSYKTFNINGGGIKTSGVDFAVTLNGGEVMGTQLTTGFDGSFLLKYDDAPYFIEGFQSNAAGVQKRAGTFRASSFVSFPEVRANAFLNLARGPHNLRWQTRFVSSTVQSDATAVSLAATFRSVTKVGYYFQHDLTYRIDLPWKTQATLSVQNILDTAPPFAFAMQYNYDPSTVNPLGRVYSFGLKKQF